MIKPLTPSDLFETKISPNIVHVFNQLIYQNWNKELKLSSIVKAKDVMERLPSFDFTIDDIKTYYWFNGWEVDFFTNTVSPNDSHYQFKPR